MQVNLIELLDSMQADIAKLRAAVEKNGGKLEFNWDCDDDESEESELITAATDLVDAGDLFAAYAGIDHSTYIFED